MTKRKPNLRRMLIVLGLAVAGTASLLVCLMAGLFAYLMLRGSEAPGEGAKAEQGYRACQPIIAALQAYHDKEGVYPATLDALVPDYLGDVAQAANEWPIEYRLTDTSYSLSFSYTGPGMNHCTYTPEAGWYCYGYY
jgi:hypothetical protein